jgi:lipopolysaccharide transport system permease protein
MQTQTNQDKWRSRPGKFWVNLNPIRILYTLHSHRGLLKQFVMRSFHERHKGSVLGVLWAVLLPIMMMGLYTLVFGFIFGSSYGVIVAENKTDFGLGIFLSLTLFGLVSEAFGLSPTIVLNNPNFVRKVVFPLELLPVASFGASLLNFLISILLFLIGLTFFGRGLCIHALWLPLIIAPLALLSIGVYWIFSALGVFLRDLSQVMVFVTQAMLYSSAIFYSTSKIKGTHLEFLLPVLQLNPIVHAVELSRNVMLWHLPMQISDLAFLYGLSGVVFCFGFAFFQALKPAFSDVI